MKRFFYNSVDSTNKEARRLILSESVDPPFSVYTDKQTDGRGYHKNQWESEAGRNITQSFVVQLVDIPPAEQFRITQMVSLGVVDFLELFIENVRIKWPNDIYFEDQKICGILIENDITGSEISLSIIGIGLNVNQTAFVSDAPNPISLKQITNIDFQLPELYVLLETCVLKRLDTAAYSWEELHAEYLKYLYRFKEYVPYKANNQWFEARITGIGEFGELILEDITGMELSFGFKEVEFIIK